MPEEVTITLNKKTVSGFIAGAVVASVIFSLVLIVQGKWSGGNNSGNLVQNNPPSAQPPAPTAEINILPVEKIDHVRGTDKAEVTMIEYSDLECPFCKRFHPTMQQIFADYKGKVRWVYRHFPLAQLHSKATKEAEASECVAQLGGHDAFWKYIDKIYEITPSNDGLDLALLPKLAGDVGVNVAKFNDCLNSGGGKAKVQRDEQDALSAGGQGTPYTVLINKKGQKIPVSGALPVDQIKAMIDSLL